MKTLIVTRDNMPFQACHPIARELRNLGHEVRVLADPSGVSASRWLQTEFKPETNSGPEIVIDRFKPDVLISGISNPAGIEQDAMICANGHGIPVVAYSDIWGSASRIKSGKPDLVLTIDCLDLEMVHAMFPNARVTVVGDWVNGPISEPNNPWSANKKTAFIAGQNPLMHMELIKSMLCRINDKSSWEVAFREHPKWIGSQEAAGARSFLSSHVSVINTNVTSDELATTADVTISCFSGALRVAVLASKLGISVETPKTIGCMVSSIGLSTYPLVKFGCCYGTSADFTLEDLLLKGAHRESCASYRNSVWPHRMGLAIQEIVELSN